MKIGILTYHRAHNYGAMLQAYALRTFLQKQGHWVEFIDYWPDSHRKQYTLIKPIRGNSITNKFINIISDSLTLIRRYKRIKQFENFRNKYLDITEHIRYTSNTNPILERYDCVIVGSDQVWRTQEYEGKYIGFDAAYFFQNILYKTRCISYAASMGIISLTPEDKKQLQQYLNKFNSILVREDSLKQLINSILLPAHVVLDPTLLLSHKEWNALLPKTRYYNKSYILYYELIQSKEALIYAKKRARAMNCELLIMESIIHTLPRKHHISNASPIDFMHAIRDAEYVIATSFHGTAFSIIFEKQFVTIGLKKNADRVITLLKQLHISEHYQDIPADIPNIDYDATNNILNDLRQQSQYLLLNSLL